MLKERKLPWYLWRIVCGRDMCFTSGLVFNEDSTLITLKGFFLGLKWIEYEDFDEDAPRLPY